MALKVKTEEQAPWYAQLDPNDWLLDGVAIRSKRTREMWAHLDWSESYCDMGPSPAGNLGPYWHVPLYEDGEHETTHRLYPKILGTRWFKIIRVAIEDRCARAIRRDDNIRRAGMKYEGEE